MRTRIEISPDHCDLTHGLLQPRRLRGAEPGLRIALVAGQALLLAGDEVHVDVTVSGPVQVTIIEPAGTVAYDMRGGEASWNVSIVLRAGARLDWRGEPFVVAHGADVVRRTAAEVGEGCVLRARETLVLGRTGEIGGRMKSGTRATLGGRPAIVEELSLDAEHRAGWAVLRGHRVLDTLTTIGERLPDDVRTLQLQEPGSVRRWIGDDLHRSDVSSR